MTSEKTRELVRRTKQALNGGSLSGTEEPTPRAPTVLESDSPVQAREMKALYLAVQKVNRALPRMVEDLVTTFHDPSTTANQKRGIFRDLASFALTDDRLAKEMGLLRRAAEDHGGGVLLRRLQISVEELRLKGDDALSGE